MELTHCPSSLVVNPSHSPSPAASAEVCPICAGQLLTLRGVYRCVRCSFTFCVGCEAEMEPPAAD